jgi:hypothetical protein
LIPIIKKNKRVAVIVIVMGSPSEPSIVMVIMIFPNPNTGKSEMTIDPPAGI